ncbi:MULTISPECIES: hypothetical protein [Pseudomonas]|uniref:Phage tail protein n=1 Tax=Pseudomonas putida TaxID=303 RepID=A0A1L7N5W7_PSEPU|nr:MULTISPECIES: hypothetical protein [Pseudomonas]MBP2085698.1 hypothetical protein [Pseudomonas sp. PvP089]MBP2088600.1 hypothetical protein [Pseudomonas sp. PvP088]MBP2225080.1 hypothetical protein [Pseudomonas putida]MCE0890592.1 hypothetical protein [Pseudomonas alloputida]MCE0919854.1 hypothetical protein [Pseudomonas alloputida]
MRKDNLNVTFNGNNYNGFEFAILPLGAARLCAAQQIDEAADNSRVAVVGNSLRVIEYQLAEQEAQAFQAAGFEGEVPPTVQAWVDAADLSPQEAAENILAEAAAWKGALYTIRAARLKGKQQALKAASHDEAEAIADAAIAAINASVVGVGNA